MRVFVLLSFLLWMTVLEAQQRNFKRYAAEYGIQASIKCIFQDSRGYIWIGTQNGGINRYDGQHFVNYSKSNGLLGNSVTDICEDKNGNLWIGTANGLNYFDGKNFKKYGPEDGLGNYPVNKICCTKSGDIWIASSEGLVRYNGHKFIGYSVKNGLKSNKVDAVFADSHGKIWLSYDPDERSQQVSCFDGKTFSHYTVFRKNQAGIDEYGKIFFFYEDRNGNMWTGGVSNGPGSLSIFKRDGFYPYNEFQNMPGVFDMLIDKKKNIWLGTRKGIFKADFEKILLHEKDSVSVSKHLFNYVKGISDEPCLDFMEDNSGNMWFGTSNGIVKFQGDVFLHYGASENYNSAGFRIFEDKFNKLWVGDDGTGFCRLEGDTLFKHIREILQVRKPLRGANSFVKNGVMWFGSEMDGLFKYDGGSIVHYDQRDGLKMIDGRLLPTRPVYSDRNGVLWCASIYKGMSVFRLDESQPKGKQIKYVDFSSLHGLDSSYAGDFPVGIFIDSKNCIWLTYSRHGLVTIKNGVVEAVPVSKILVDNHFTKYFEDSKGGIWFTDGNLPGIARFYEGKFTWYNEKNGCTSAKVWQFKEDKYGKVWIATDGDGLFVFENGKIRNISSKDGLNDNTIWNVVFDRNNNVWAGTNKGINKIRLDKKGEVWKIKSYGINEGFIGVECNNEASYVDSKGNIWFGTPIGVTRYIPGEDIIDKNPPELNMLEVKLFFKKTDWSVYGNPVNTWTGLPSELSLPYNQNHLTFSFIGISLRSSDKVRYKFKLVGQENKWSPETDKNEITYSGLSPGTYEFQVKSCNANGDWNKKPLTYKFTILPPWWQTWWFRSLMVCSLLFVLYIVFRWRNAALLKRQAVLEKTVVERTAEVVHQKEVIEEKQKEILDSINYAKRIQDAILPSQKTIKECLPDSFILYLPKDIVAGDFYFVEPSGNKTIFAAADCTGHGVPGAMVSVVCANAMKRTIKEFGLTKPGPVLDKVTDLVLETFESSGTDVKDGMDISFCAFDKTSLLLEWSGANNPLWIVRNGEILEYNADKQPIGKFDNRKPFSTHAIQLKKGDEIFIFTDGYGDQFGGPKNKKFKLANMKTLFVDIKDLPCEQQMLRIHEMFDRWKEHYEQVDDVCVIGVKI
jgi:ligand-binding sensor domain-containing protein/serine phosphatase RsbU (regulator of sigma subunit)